MAKMLCLHDQSWALLLWMAEVCVHDPRISAQSLDPRFAQQNPRMVRIRTLHITYILYVKAMI